MTSYGLKAAQIVGKKISRFLARGSGFVGRGPRESLHLQNRWQRKPLAQEAKLAQVRDERVTVPINPFTCLRMGFSSKALTAALQAANGVRGLAVGLPRELSGNHTQS